MLWNFFKKKNPTTEIEVSAHDGTMKEMHQQLTDVGERLRKMELRQKEASLQLDEINDLLQDGETDHNPLLDALIAYSVQIENFYRFAANDTLSPLFEQARMMWSAAKSAGESAEFEMIDDSSVPFDFKRHEAESCEQVEGIPAGHVIRTLKCGYCYKGEVIRRAAVVVNKLAVK